MKKCLYLILIMFFSFQTVQAQRAIAFEGIENARDMGGLVMQDGKKISTGKLVRSGNLSKASDSDVAILKDSYHLTNVFDFRFEAEANGAPDRIMDGVSYTHLSTIPTAFTAAFSSGRADTAQINTKTIADALMRYAANPQAQTMAKRLYPSIVTDSLAQRYYGEFLKGVLHSKGGALWHCSQGKDRAGMASAFLLAALGAGRDVIVADFDLSNQSYAAQVEALTAKIRENGGSEGAVGFISAMIGVSKENFESTLDLIDKQYGSLSQYIENQLGFSKEEQQQLREKYLE